MYALFMSTATRYFSKLITATENFGTNIGINTTTPAYPLDVNGDINVSGKIRRKGRPYRPYPRLSKDAAEATVSSWRTRTPPTNMSWQSVCWAPELSMFCAVANSGTGNRVMTSSDGITWTTRASAADNNWKCVCWAPELSMFCAVANTGTGNRVMTSADGITWVSRSTPKWDNQWVAVCWSPELSMFCAVSNAASSSDVLTSPDGLTWTAHENPGYNFWSDICWSPELSMFCAVCTSTRNIIYQIMTSSDGITWVLRSCPAKNAWKGVCWSPELSMFCAVANSGTGNRVMTSNDGITWTPRASAADNNWENVCWAPELSMFCAVAYSGTGNRVMMSADGINWQTRATPVDNRWSSVCWAPELSMFCAVADTGPGDQVMTSGAPAWRPTPGYTNLYLDTLGTGTVYSSAGALTNTAPSDKDLKRDIVPLTDALSVMNRLRPVSFEWQDATRFGDRQEYGLIAQEVQEVLPDLVNNDPATQILGYDPVSLIPFAIQATKELDALCTQIETALDDAIAKISNA